MRLLRVGDDDVLSPGFVRQILHESRRDFRRRAVDRNESDRRARQADIGPALDMKMLRIEQPDAISGVVSTQPASENAARAASAARRAPAAAGRRWLTEIIDTLRLPQRGSRLGGLLWLRTASPI